MIRQAILIIAHNNIEILNKLIETLDSKYFDIYIHVDKKSNIKVEDIKSNGKESNIYIYKVYDIRWADYSQIECELFLLKKSIENGKYSYYHLISGVDFPIKSNKYIFDFFSNSNKEFIHFEAKNFPKYKEDYYFRRNFNIKNYKKNSLNKIINKTAIYIQKIFNIKINENVNFRVGSNWFSITNELAEYITSNEGYIKEVFKYSRSGDESFIQTLVYNSKFVDNLYNENFDNDYESCQRYIDWKRGNPYIFRNEDYNELINSNCCFARKFDKNIDMTIIEKLIRNRS